MTDTDKRLYRRVAGWHDIRLDGLTDLLLRAPGASVFDIGCNRGLVGFEFFANGASVVHGCDIYADGITTARHLFCDLRNCQSQFEVIDLSKGVRSLEPFGDRKYDVTLMLATYHKLKRVMEPQDLTDLVVLFAKRTNRYFAWRGTSDKNAENQQEIFALDRDLATTDMKRIHTSNISKELGVAAIWERT